MDDSDADEAAIMAVLKAETDAWLRRDFPALAQHWVHSPKTRRMIAVASLGTQVVEGWDAIASRLKTSMERLPTKYELAERIHWERVNVNVIGDMAWVSYDQVGTDTGDDFDMPGVQHELKIFHRIDGAWKIGCLVLMERTVEHEAGPLIEVDADGKVLWMNQPARERIRDHPALVIAAGRLRTRRRECDAALRDALGWAFHQLQSHVPPKLAAQQARPVLLGENEAGAAALLLGRAGGRQGPGVVRQRPLGRPPDRAGGDDLRSVAGTGPTGPPDRGRPRSRRRLGDSRRERQHAQDASAADVRPDRGARPGGAGRGAAERRGANQVGNDGWFGGISELSSFLLPWTAFRSQRSTEVAADVTAWAGSGAGS